MARRTHSAGSHSRTWDNRHVHVCWHRYCLSFAHRTTRTDINTHEQITLSPVYSSSTVTLSLSDVVVNKLPPLLSLSSSLPLALRPAAALIMSVRQSAVGFEANKDNVFLVWRHDCSSVTYSRMKKKRRSDCFLAIISPPSTAKSTFILQAIT